MPVNIRLDLGPETWAEVRIEGAPPTRADYRRLIGLLTAYMELAPDAPTAPEVARRLARARELIYPGE